MRNLAIILAVWCAGLGAAAQFGKISVLFEDLAQNYAGQGAFALGLVVSVVGFVGLVFGTTAGLLVARIGPRRAIVLALVMGAGMSVLQALILPYGAMIASRIVEGFSHLAIVVVGPTLIAAVANDRYRGLAMTLWSSFFGVTYALLAVFAPMVIGAFGAAGLFLGHALWMAAIAAVLAVLLPKDPVFQAKPDTAGLLAQHVTIYASPWLSAPATGFFFYTFLYVAALTLLPVETALAYRGVVAVGMPLISIALSLTLGVWLLSRMTAVRLVQWGYVAAIPGFVLLALTWGQGAGMAVAALWLSAALGLVQGASFASIPELNHSSEDRARAAGAIAQLGNLGTTTGTPVLAALLAGQGPVALVICAVVMCGMGIAAHAINARRRQDGTT